MTLSKWSNAVVGVCRVGVLTSLPRTGIPPCTHRYGPGQLLRAAHLPCMGPSLYRIPAAVVVFPHAATVKRCYPDWTGRHRSQWSRRRPSTGRWVQAWAPAAQSSASSSPRCQPTSTSGLAAGPNLSTASSLVPNARQRTHIAPGRRYRHTQEPAGQASIHASGHVVFVLRRRPWWIAWTVAPVSSVAAGVTAARPGVEGQYCVKPSTGSMPCLCLCECVSCVCSRDGAELPGPANSAAS